MKINYEVNKFYEVKGNQIFVAGDIYLKLSKPVFNQKGNEFNCLNLKTGEHFYCGNGAVIDGIVENLDLVTFINDAIVKQADSEK